MANQTKTVTMLLHLPADLNRELSLYIARCQLVGVTISKHDAVIRLCSMGCKAEMQRLLYDPDKRSDNYPEP